jgi:hypothetical protein
MPDMVRFAEPNSLKPRPITLYAILSFDGPAIQYYLSTCTALFLYLNSFSDCIVLSQLY